MGSTTKTVTGTTNTAPWSGQQPYLSDGFDIARQDLAAAANGSIGQYYPGQTYTPADWKTNAGVNSLFTLGANGTDQQNQANANTSNLLSNGAGALPGSGTLSGIANNGSGAMGLAGGGTLGAFSSGAYSGNNPYLSNMISQSFNAARPAIDSAFASSGRLGSGNHDAALANSIANTTGQLGYQNYGDSLNRQMSAAGTLSNQDLAARQMQAGAAGTLNQNALNAYGLGQQGAQQANQAAQQGAQNMLAAGGTTEGYNDKAIQAAMQQWNYNQNKPWNDLSNYMGMIQGNYGGSSTTTQPIQTTNPWMQGAGAGIGLLGAAGLAAGTGGLGALLAPAAAGGFAYNKYASSR